MNDIEQLKKRTSQIATFLLKKSGDKSIEMVLSIIEATYKKKNVRGLQKIEKDLKEWVKSLSEEHQLELYQNLDIDNVNKIDSVVMRNKIETDEEYKNVMERVENIYNDTAFSEELKILNTLLADYEAKK
jgi:hypothetical protein